jgi:CRP-like cAMP-binding protein
LFEYDEFVRDWFMTYHIFVKPEEFLRLLRNKYTSALEDYEEEEGAEIIESVLHIMHLWVDLEKGADFENNADLMKLFDDFVELVGKKNAKASKELKESLAAALESLRNPPEPDAHNAPAPQLTKKKYPPGVVPPVTEMEPLELAKQMTLMEAQLLRKVRAKEFHGTAWAKRDAETRAPNLTKVINISNQLSNWMITEILKLGSVGEMAEAIIKFIRVGKHMVQMNNFSGAMEVATALNNSAVGKLKAAWAAIPPKTKSELDELNDLTSPLGHYKNYRAAFAGRDAELPCLPILAATLSDLNGFEEVFSNNMPDGSVNWKKMSRLADRIWENVSLNCMYNFKPLKEVMDYIETAFVWRESATTCAIADLRMKEIAKQGDKAAQDRRIRRKSTSVSNLADQLDAPKEDLSERDWQILLTGSQPKKFKANQVILKAGSPNEHLFRVKSGKVKVMKEIEGQEVHIATMGENAMFGEVSMLLRSQKGSATASIVAEGEVELYQLQIEFVLQLLEAHPHIAEKLNRILAIKLARRLREVGTKKTPPPSSSAGSESQAQGAASPSLKDSKSKRSLKKEAESSAPLESTPEEEKRAKEGGDKSDSPDAKFNKMFKLDGEVIIREIECSFKGSITMHGSLFVSQNYLGANFSMFGFKMREALPFSSIKDIKKSKKNINIVLNEDGKAFSFTGFGDYEDAFQFIRSIWKHQSGQKPSGATSPKASSTKKDKSAEPAPADDDDAAPTTGDSGNKWLPSVEDWDLILKGARTVTYRKDDVVIREGEQFRRIFQLARGECRFEKIIDGKSKVLGKMGKDSKDDNLFGEISFLEGGRASASVVCDKDDTQIAIIEGYFLEILFEYYPDLPGRFYHYLAAVLSKRLKQRESGSTAPAPVGGSKDTLKESGGSETEKPKDKEKKHKKKKSSAKELNKSGSSSTLSVSASEDEESAQ